MASSSALRRGPVIVGVDGSAASLAAVDLAAAEAMLHGRPLRVVHGFVALRGRPDPGGATPDDLRSGGEHLVTAAVNRARLAAPSVEVVGELVAGDGADALISNSHGAALVVVGHRGLGALAGLLVGSVAIRVAARAACPVLVARGTSQPRLPVLVAADGSPAGDAAMEFAFEAAAARPAPLVALHVWPHPAETERGDAQRLIYDRGLTNAEDIRVIAESLAEWHAKYPHVAVHRRVVHARVRQTIIDATRDAQLVVLGARGHGGFAGLLLGSVSQAVLRHAACPTAIVRQHL